MIGSAQQNTMHGVLRRFHLFLFKQTQNLTRSMVVFLVQLSESHPPCSQYSGTFDPTGSWGWGQALAPQSRYTTHPCSGVSLQSGEVDLRILPSDTWPTKPSVPGIKLITQDNNLEPLQREKCNSPSRHTERVQFVLPWRGLARVAPTDVQLSSCRSLSKTQICDPCNSLPIRFLALLDSTDKGRVLRPPAGARLDAEKRLAIINSSNLRSTRRFCWSNGVVDPADWILKR